MGQSGVAERATPREGEAAKVNERHDRIVIVGVGAWEGEGTCREGAGKEGYGKKASPPGGGGQCDRAQ